MHCWIFVLLATTTAALAATLSDEQTRALFELCLTDAECRTLYGQHKGPDYRLCEHLARREVSERAMALSKSAPQTDTERLVSVLLLNDIRHNSIDLCTTNQVPVLDPESGTVDCVCIEDRDCSPVGDSGDISPIVLLVLITLMEALSFAAEIYRFYGGGGNTTPPPRTRSRKGK
jgi:hypothetical protein